MTTHTPVDGADARVIHREADPPIAIFNVETDDLCQLLANKGHEYEEQNKIVKREKKKLETIECEYDEIVAELRKRGEAAATGQTSFFDRPQRTYPPRNESATVQTSESADAGDVIQQPGATRLALNGTVPERGAYERIPQEAEPTFCVCGSTMDSPADLHDVDHAKYASDHVAALAPDAATLPSIEDPTKRTDLRGIARVSCTSKNCRSEIIFGVSEKGRSLPIDAEPVPSGGYAIAGRTAAGIPIIRKATGADAARYQPHARACADTKTFGSSARLSATASKPRSR